MHGMDIIEIEDLMNFFCADNYRRILTFLNGRTQAESYISPYAILTAACFAYSGIPHCQYHQHNNKSHIRQEKLHDTAFAFGRH